MLNLNCILLVFFGLGLSSALLTPNPGYPLLDVAMLFLIALTAFSLACIRQLTNSNFDKLLLISVAVMGVGILLQEVIEE